MELTFIFIIGILIGSFLNVVILRIPKDESIAFPASHCGSCKKPLKWFHNIPLFSWAFLRGKCAFCQEKISIQYPIIELLSGVLFVVIFAKMGISIPTLLVAFSFLTLLALSVIDLHYKMVPDSLNLLALTLAIAAAYSLTAFVDNLVNALIFAGAFTLLRFYISFAINREAMGEADIMVAATMGALLGVKLTLVAIFISALLALPAMLLTQDKEDPDSLELPYIPFLALATLLVYIFDTPIYAYLEATYG
ncbi:MAG: prepilin peptidase [Helicobacteraceae bacterium]|nr:prepilin peptidase [Helicobacteraceae bacterium]